MKHLLSAIVALSALGSAAQAEVDIGASRSLVADADWRRVASPDGKISVMLPCKESETSIRSLNGGFAIQCNKFGLVFAVSHGIVSPDPADNGKPRTYERYQASSKAVVAPEEYSELTVQGHPAFQVICTGRDGVACMQIIDLAPGKPLIVAAVEAVPGSTPPEQVQPTLAVGLRFYQSLEIAQ